MFRVKKEIKQAIKQQLMKTRSTAGSPYADLDEKVLMRASLQHTFSFKPAHG